MLLIIMVVKEMTYSIVPLTGELTWINMCAGSTLAKVEQSGYASQPS